MTSPKTYQLFFGEGTSQAPVIPANSLLEIENCAASEYRVGDLVLYLHSKSYICHRLLSVKRELGLVWFYLKGDRCRRGDGWFPEYRIVGKVIKLNDRPFGIKEGKLVHWLWTARSKLGDCYWSFRWLVYRKLYG